MFLLLSLFVLSFSMDKLNYFCSVVLNFSVIMWSKSVQCGKLSVQSSLDAIVLLLVLELPFDSV